MSINQDHIGDANKMVSSIEFLVKEINQIIDFIPMNKWDEIRVVVQQAKAMHKEEIMDANFYGQRLHAKSVTNTMMEDNAEQYYNETFGGNND